MPNWEFNPMLRRWVTKTAHWGLETHATASALGQTPMLLATASAQTGDTFLATLDPATSYIPGPFGQLNPSPHRIYTHTFFGIDANASAEAVVEEGASGGQRRN